MNFLEVYNSIILKIYIFFSKLYKKIFNYVLNDMIVWMNLNLNKCVNLLIDNLRILKNYICLNRYNGWRKNVYGGFYLFYYKVFYV